MKRLLLGLFCVLLSGVASAAGPNAVRKRVEASMLVTGSIIVASDGSVNDCAIDQADKLPPGVVDLVKKAASTWRFRPIMLDGKAVNAKAKMSLRIVARKAEGDSYVISLHGMHFGQDGNRGAAMYKQRSRFPKYPPDAVRAGVTGTVYLVLNINRQGQVDAAAAEQVNLGVVDSDAAMDRWRRMLADASLAAARTWTFNAPASGPDAHADHWVVRIPVNFNLDGRPNPQSGEYGKWNVYIPGPAQLIPWLNSKQIASASVDALPSGVVSPASDELHLITSPGGI